jgi:hypothetical protein
MAQGDKDGDKQLSKSELMDVAGAWFDKLDSGHTGKLTQEQLISKLAELFPAPPAATPDGSARPGQAPGGLPTSVTPEVLGPILFAVADGDKDGILTSAEFKQTFGSWFDRWDGDKTGKLSEDSLRRGLEAALPRSNTPERTPTLDARARPGRAESVRGPEAPRESGQSAGLGSTNRLQTAGPPPDAAGAPKSRREFAAFKIITDRNIFNPNRRPSRRDSEPEARPKSVDTLTLVGTLSYEKGEYAFFDGSSGELRQVRSPGEMVVGYKVAAISPGAVTLQSGTNNLQLRVGMELRREEQGEWQVVQGSGPPDTTAQTTSPSSSEGSDDDSDIVRRLMKQREQELK